MDWLKKKKTKTTQIQNKTKQKNVQSKDLKFQTTQYNLSKILWRLCFVLVWLHVHGFSNGFNSTFTLNIRVFSFFLKGALELEGQQLLASPSKSS